MNDEGLEEIAQEIYGCDDNPLDYMIEPRGMVEAVDKDAEINPRGF